MPLSLKEIRDEITRRIPGGNPAYIDDTVKLWDFWCPNCYEPWLHPIPGAVNNCTKCETSVSFDPMLADGRVRWWVLKAPDGVHCQRDGWLVGQVQPGG